MMRIELSDLGDIDFGIITIREDEYLAVFDRLRPEDICQGRRTYDVGSVVTSEHGQYRFALIRAIAQGEGTAQDVARDMVEDLHPKWLLLVGIGGAVPSADFTLGDVVCATRVHDFCVRAAKFNAAESFAAGGGPMHRDVENLLSRLPGIERRLTDWNSQESIGMPMPAVVVPEEGSDRYYGSKEWQAEVRRWLTYRFMPSGALRRPGVTARPVASSDVLVKDSNLLEQWLTEARAVAAVEMELAGVYFAARRHDREYPILAIRGISDVVGFKRDEAWTKYACNTAAAFAVALIKSGEMHLPGPAPTGGESTRHATSADPDGTIPGGNFSVEGAARDAFLRGMPSDIGIGLTFPDLTFVGWLSRRGKSAVANYSYSGVPFVVKKTSIAQCDVSALEQISGTEISGSDWRVRVTISTPLSIRVMDKCIYELHRYYHGIRVDRLVARNRFRICGDYLGATHNSFACMLDQLHRKGLVHRDVRPQNLLLGADGSFILLDCSFVARQGTAQKPVDSGIYTAPEQLEGKSVAQSDWYSLAATMYFIATGYPPSVWSTQAPPDLSHIDVGAYDPPWWGYEKDIYAAPEAWAAIISAGVEARPKNLSEIIFHEHSRSAMEETLISVLDMEDMGYLLIFEGKVEVVSRADINARLSCIRYARADIEDGIRKHLDGRPSWVVSSTFG